MNALLREEDINPRKKLKIWGKKIQDPAGIQSQDLLNASQLLLPLGQLAT